MNSRYKMSYSPNFADILRELGCTLAISTYQAGKVVFICAGQKQSLTQIPVSFRKPMGIAVRGDSLAVATIDEIQVYSKNKLLAETFPENPGFYESLYLPRAVFCSGETDLHDLSFGEGGLWAVNTRFSCLSTFDIAFSFQPRWKPSFISALVPEDRCHLNGMAMNGSRPEFVTALSNTDSLEGWRENITETGLLMRVPDGEIILDNLPMPHSPRLTEDGLFVLLSASGEVLQVDPTQKTYTTILRTNSFIRGLTKIGNYLFIGKSMIRKSSKTFSKLSFPEANNYAGMIVYDLSRSSVVAELKYMETIEEIYDVVVIPDVSLPGLISFADERSRLAVSTPKTAFWRKSAVVESK